MATQSVTLKRFPGLSWKRQELQKDIEARKMNTDLAPVFAAGSKALEKHIQIHYRDFGASQVDEKKPE